MRTTYGRACKLALLLALLWGCGGATFTGGIFDNGTVRYQVGRLGPTWQRVEVDGNDLAFHHANLGTVSVNSTCHEYEDVPELALANELLFGTRDRHYRTEEYVTLDGRGALHQVVDLELDGVPVTLDVYVLKKDGCVYDLSLISSRAAFSRARPEFAELVHGFHVLRTRLD